MTSRLVLFVSVTGMLVIWWAILIRGIPWVIRARFERKVAEIQRELDEAVLCGDLPLGDPSVEAISRTLDAVVDHSDRLTPAFSRMMNRAMNKHGRPIQVRARSQSFANLSADQRRLMHGLDGRLTEALTLYVKFGSPSGWWHSLTVVFRHLGGKFLRRSARSDAGSAAAECANVDRRASEGEDLLSTRLAMGALLDPEVEPGMENSFPDLSRPPLK